jgi:hypothetical protein
VDQPRSLSALLLDISDRYRPIEKITVGSLIEAFHERGFGFFLFLIALPIALPVPAVGVSTLLALPLLLLTAQQALGFHAIWLPEKLKRKEVSSEGLQKLIDMSMPWVKRLEYFVRPRLAFMTQGVFSHLIGISGFIMALSNALPLPLANTVPCAGICLMAIGVLMRDGLAVMAGALLGLGWVTMLIVAFVFFGIEGLDLVKEWIKSFL